MKKNHRRLQRAGALLLSMILAFPAAPAAYAEEPSLLGEAELMAPAGETPGFSEIQEETLPEEDLWTGGEILEDTESLGGGEQIFAEEEGTLLEDGSFEMEDISETGLPSMGNDGGWFAEEDPITDEDLSGEEDLTGDEAAEPEVPEDEDPAEEDPEEETKEGVRYIKGRPLTEEEAAEQLAPIEELEPITSLDMDPMGEDLAGDALNRVGASAVYDMRKKGLVTSVKDQGGYADCWAFAIAAGMETSLLNEGSGAYDLSEEHLAYFLGNRANDPLQNTPNDRNLISGDYHDGGNTQLAATYLSTWAGMALEASYPHGNGPFSSGNAYDTAAYLRDASFFSNNKSNSLTSRTNRIKNMIIRYKAVTVELAFSATAASAASSYYNPDTAAACNPNENAAVNHGVTLVGWDDNYSKNNFKSNGNVKADGAWIAKNSWGSSWGDHGYFYISYEDMSMKNVVAVSGTASPEYPNNYFYDGSSGLSGGTIDNGDSVACIFRATAGGKYAETLGEIVTHAATDASVFDVQVYVGVTDHSDPSSGTAAYSTPVRVTQQYVGMQTHTVPEVDIAPGSYYSVVLTNRTGKAIKYYYETSISYSWCSFQAGTAPQQAFEGFSTLDETGEMFWADTDAGSASPRIKAHTRTESFVPSIQVSQTEYTITRGGKASLKLSASPASYGSLGFKIRNSNSSVVSISNGTIYGASPGKAVLTAWSLKMPNKTVKVNVTVLPQTPSSLTAKMTAYNKVSLSWSRVSGCDGYYIYRQEGSANPKYRRLVSGEANVSCVDTENPSAGIYLIPGTRYRYYVRAYKIFNGEKILSAASPVKEVYPTLKKEIATVRTFTELYNTISYQKIDGADGYRIYRRENGGAWQLIHTRNSGTPALLKDKKSLKNLTRYQYKVVPFRQIAGKKYDGPYGCSGTLLTVPPQTRVTQINRNGSGFRIIWSKRNECTGYLVYRRVKGGSWKRIFTIKDGTRSSVTDNKVTKGNSYQYYVVGYVKQFYNSSVLGTYKESSYVKCS